MKPAGPLLTLLGALALGLAGCSKPAETAPAAGATPPGAADATPARFALVFENDWLAVPEQGGFFQALETGLYSAAGLDVTFRHGGPYERTPQSVAVGKAHIGIGGSDEVMIAVDKDFPLVIVAPFMQHHPYGLISYSAHPVKTLADLRGRTVTAFAGATWITILKHQSGIDFGIAPLTTSIAGFMADPTKMAIEQIFVTNEPYFARQQGADIHVLRIGDTGWDPYRVIFTTRDFAAKHPDVVRRFVAASRQGWHDYLQGDSSAADKRIQEKNPAMKPDYVAFVRRTLIETKMVTGQRDQGQMQLDLAKLDADLATLREAGLLKRPLVARDLATTEFLPAP